MAQFEDNRLQINGITMYDRFHLHSVTVKGKEERFYGINRSLEFENGTYIGKKDDNPPTFTIELAKADYWGNPLPFNQSELDEINRLIYKKDIAVLYVNGYFYYGSFSQGELVLYGDKGYLSLQFNSAYPYCFTAPLLNSIRVVGEKTIEIYNNSNVVDFLLFDIEIEKIGQGNVTIENLTVKNNKMVIKNVSDREIIKVYGEIYTDIVSETNPDKNMHNSYDGEFVGLRYGRNMIKVIGDCRINFLHQEPRVIK
ncbi:MAG: hypothetical protein ACRDD7_18140 [Peptostreptococcaceae bacterium]